MLDPKSGRGKQQLSNKKILFTQGRENEGKKTKKKSRKRP
jgi:hypothetical protein